MHIDARQACLNYIEVAVSRSKSNKCADVKTGKSTDRPAMQGTNRKGLPDPLYNLWKRIPQSSTDFPATTSNFRKRDFTKACSFSINGCQAQKDKSSMPPWYLTSMSPWYLPAIVFVSTVLVVRWFGLWFGGRQPPKGDVFTSPARFDYQITRHHESGPEVITGQAAKFIRHSPDEDQYPGELRRSIQLGEADGDADDRSAWQPYNSSTDTLVNPWAGHNPSKVSITNHPEDEKHEGLIELETAGDNKTFFDPETGEFIHITPWKSTQDDDTSVKADDRGSVKRAIGKMFPGGMALGGGKAVGDAVKDKTEEVAKSTTIERWHDEMIQRKGVPQQAGDCMTGDLTKEAPSGRPQLA